MPIFEYECRDCKNQFEIITTSSQVKETIECPECKSTDVIKNISAASFRMGSPVRPGRNSSGCGNSGFS